MEKLPESQKQSLLPTHSHVCHRDCADTLYIATVMVHSSAFSYAWICHWTQFSGDIFANYGLI